MTRPKNTEKKTKEGGKEDLRSPKGMRDLIGDTAYLYQGSTKKPLK